jgi:hypothetical protein
VQIVHVVLLDLTGFDYLKPLARLFHLVANIPQPRHPSAFTAKPALSAAASVTSKKVD